MQKDIWAGKLLRGGFIKGRIPPGIYTLYGGSHGLEVYVGDLRVHYGYDAPVGSEPYKVEVIR